MKLILVARPSTRLQQVAKDLEHLGAWVRVLPADLSRPDTIQPLAQDAVALTGRLDVLVNNAATACFLPLHRCRAQDLQRELFVNLTAPVLMTRCLLPHMIAQGSGHVVNVSSLAAEVPIAYLASYSAAKAGMASFVRSLRQELAGTGVSASAVLPGVVRDQGMIRDFETRSGVAPSSALGGCTAQRVAQGVVRAIRRDLPDVVVDRPGTRLLLALLRLMPKTMERAIATLRIQDSFQRGAALNLESGGSLIGPPIDSNAGPPRPNRGDAAQ